MAGLERASKTVPGRYADRVTGANRTTARASDRGFTLPELMIAMFVFMVIMGSVVALVARSQSIFRTEQGVSDMDQNARLLIDFLTRDIQQAKENAVGLGDSFSPIFSYNGPDGKTDEITILSSDTESKIPSAALPLIPASGRSFSVNDHYVELLPNTAGRLRSADVADTITPDEHLIFSRTLQDGSVQFDIVKAKSARVTETGAVGLGFEPVDPRGVQSEVPFGSTYHDGAFSVRPVAVKRYFVDRSSDKNHPVFAMSVSDGAPIPIARNVVAFQLRYLQVMEGFAVGQWYKEQNISHQYKTTAVEVTMTARTEIAGDNSAERLVTLASVIRPRFQPGSGSQFGSGGSGGGMPFGTGGGGSGGAPTGSDGSGTSAGGGSGGSGSGGAGFAGSNSGSGAGRGQGIGMGGYRNETRRIGQPPRLGQRLNQPQDEPEP